MSSPVHDTHGSFEDPSEALPGVVIHLTGSVGRRRKQLIHAGGDALGVEKHR
jgi:hypothetical protein